MSDLPCIRYPRPDRLPRQTAWSRDWRRRWFCQVGAVVQHKDDGGLHTLYSDDRDPAARLALQRELELRPGGPGEVIAACRAAKRDWERRVFG